MIDIGLEQKIKNLTQTSRRNKKGPNAVEFRGCFPHAKGISSFYQV